MPTISNRTRPTTRDLRPASPGGGRDRAGRSEDVLQLVGVHRPGIGDAEVVPGALPTRHGNPAAPTTLPQSEPADLLGAASQDTAPLRCSATTDARPLPRWPAYRTMRLDQPGDEYTCTRRPSWTAAPPAHGPPVAQASRR